MNHPDKYIGIDVQAVRQCPYAVLDQNGNWSSSGWLPNAKPELVAGALRRIVEDQAAGDLTKIAVGIDAPRMPLAAQRDVFWNRSKATWRGRLPSERGYGRHCEVIIAAYRMANPQWTPIANAAPAWMQLGFALFAGLRGILHVYEVFPSASYAQLSGDESMRLGLCLRNFAKGPKDMLDAYVAAATVREFVEGRGQAVGGGDGHGQIVLPRRLPKGDEGVLTWPAI